MEKSKTLKKRGKPKKTAKKESPAKKAEKITKKSKAGKTAASSQTKPLKAQLEPKKEKYFEGIGRRKTSVARVRLLLKKPDKPKADLVSFLPSENLVNGKKLEEYFPTKELQGSVLSPLGLMSCLDRFSLSIKTKGGGIVSQAEASRHGVARALVLFNPDFRKKLKKAGYLKRDPRMRERKKFGLKRARRAPQWSKR